MFDELVYIGFVDIPQRKNIVNISFPDCGFCDAVAKNLCFNSGHKNICKSNGHFSTQGGTVDLQIVLTIELERILFTYQTWHFFEILRGDMEIG